MSRMLRNQILVQRSKCVCLLFSGEFQNLVVVSKSQIHQQIRVYVLLNLFYHILRACAVATLTVFGSLFIPLPFHGKQMHQRWEHLGQCHKYIQWPTLWDSSGQTGQEQSKCFDNFDRWSLILLGDPISTDMLWASERWKHASPVSHFHGNSPESHLFLPLFGRPARVCSWGKLDALRKKFSQKEKLLRCSPAGKPQRSCGNQYSHCFTSWSSKIIGRYIPPVNVIRWPCVQWTIYKSELAMIPGTLNLLSGKSLQQDHGSFVFLS